MSNATRLALWVRSNLRPETHALTHLKLQKLVFFAYGAVAAFGLAEVGRLKFEAWEHGPVNRDVWNEYRAFGATTIPKPSEAGEAYSAGAETILGDVLSVYGRLDAWSLRQQSHLEEPWVNAFNARTPIDETQIAEHFRRKFRDDVRFPEYLARTSNFALDRIPVPRFDSLHELARAVQHALG